MKQKDKKKTNRWVGKMKNVHLPDPEILEEIKEQAKFKTARISTKASQSYKEGLKLVQGRIMEIKSNYRYIVEINGELHNAKLSGRLKQFLYSSHKIAAVGDYVAVDVAIVSDKRIEKILPRKNALIRYGTGSFQKEIILAANIDQVIITSSWLKPRLKAGLIDRYLCIVALQGLQPIIVINKIDLLDDEQELESQTAYYKAMGYPLLYTSVVSGTGMNELKELLVNKDSVFTGHSGTGKTSLINYLEPSLDLPTAEISNYNEKGKHTTSQSILIPWSFGGHLLDTPGIKTITLHSEDKEYIPKIFPGFENLHNKCKFRDCSHIHEENCAVIEAVESGIIPIERYDSYQYLYESL